MKIHSDLRNFNFLLNEIAGLYHDASLKMGIADSALQILYTVCTSPSVCHLSQIARLNGMSRQTINSAIRKLEAEGVVRLETEGRRRCVRLTEAGENYVQARVQPIIQIETELLSAWSAEEKAALFHLLEKYRGDFSQRLNALPPRAD